MVIVVEVAVGTRTTHTYFLNNNLEYLTLLKIGRRLNYLFII
jgi:hypothetical protein